MYLTLRVGKFPDTMEALVQRHLDKEDEQSALITCDLYKGTFEVCMGGCRSTPVG